MHRDQVADGDDVPLATLDDGTPADIEGELLTLCHELEHALSYDGGTDRPTWLAYRRGAKP